MENKITVSMSFSYAGEAYDFKSVIKLPAHLDGLIEFAESVPNIIGRQNKVDAYSYMYEVMACTPIKVIDAEGYVAQFLKGDSMPLHDFLAACNEVTVEMLMKHIAETHMPPETEQDKMQQALMAAYQMGLSAGEAN